MKTDWNIQAKSLENALGVLKAVCHETPDAAIVLGSGVTALMDLVSPKVLPFEEVFGLAPTVAGHTGSVTIGRMGAGDKAPLVVVFRGRFHLYEGHSWSVVTLPARIVAEWKIPKLIISGAAGGINKDYHAGDLMLVERYHDLLNPKWKEVGLVPAITKEPIKVTRELTERVAKCAEELASTGSPAMRKGVYCGLLGPSYETFAEIEMLRKLGCDAVGASVVPELEAVAGKETQVAAVAVITNIWSEQAPTGHLEVLDVAHHASSQLDKLLRAVLAEP